MQANERPEKIHGKTQAAPVPPNEVERLLVLRRYNIFGTAPEAVFDDLTRLAAQIMGTSTALLSLLDADRQWFKSKVGLEGEETPRHLSFCAHAIMQSGLFMVEDATLDERFANHPRVVGKPFIRFYAGFPLVSPEGMAIGTFCVMDTKPRRLTPEQIESLRTLAHQVMTQLDHRRNLNELSSALAERQQTKAALEVSEAFFLTLVENLPQNIFRKDVDGRFTFANEKFCKALGKPLSEIVGKTDFDFFPPELAEKFRSDDLDVMAQRKPLDTVEVNQTAGKEKTHVRVIKTPILDARGEAIGIVGIFWDVTERIRIQEALAYERDLLRALLENSPDRIYFKDTQSRFLKCSNTVVSGLGVSRAEEAVGKSDFDFFTEEHAKPAYEDEQAIMRTGQPIIGKVEKETWIDGTETWALTTKMPLHNNDGHIIGTFGITKDVTEMKRIEADLAYERDLLRALLENAPDCIYFKDRESRFIKSSLALAERFGFKDAEKLIGKKDSDFFTEEHARQAYEDEQEILRTGQPVLGKVEHETYSDGSETWALTTKMPLHNRAGEIIGTFGISKDVTALKKIEADLAFERHLLRAVLEKAPDCIYFKDKKSRFIKCSQALADRFGMAEADQMIGKSDFDLYTEEHARPAYEDEQEIIRTGQPVVGKLECETFNDGRVTWALTSKMPLRSPTGDIVGTFGISRDVTEIKKAEALLAFERDLLRSLMDSSPDRISFKDTKSRFVRCSRALLNRLGVNDPKEVEGKTDFDFHTKERAQEFYDDEQRILATGQPIINKVERQLTIDGQDAWASVSKVPIFNQEGKATGLISVSRDITQLKLTEQELGRARDAALESTRLKSEFLANMSHEIRTPMNAIIGMTGLLLETEINDEQRDFAETVRSSADALLTIINDILDFSKVEAGKLTFENIDFDLCDAVESTVELLAERSQNKGLELASWIHTDVPTRLRGDPGRIRQILTNLVGNAIKFTEQGEVVVRVTKELETEIDTFLRFEVTDTGIGIPEAALPRMFQAFTQADGSMTRKYGGTGLGLAICRQLVELMGGQIGVRSQVGKGSTFWFTSRMEKQSTDMQALPSMTKDGLVGLRVLVVDDNFTNRQIVHHQILSWRMRNGQAASGAEALGILRREAAAGDPYDLAILDMQMPEMDGLTLARAIKADPTIAATKMVVLTSLGLRIEPSELKAAGIAAYLVKPVKQSRLFDCIAVVMTGEKSEPSGPKPAQVPVKPVAPPKVVHKNVHILLAEDNPVNQKVALRQLQKLGYAADAVANGLEVLDALKQIPYAIILMDCQMPEMDGYEATRQIRQLEYRGSLAADRRAPVQIVAMTANALRGDREKCLESGMDDYISKPVVLSEMEGALNRALAKVFPETPSPMAAAAPASTEDVLDAAVLTGLRELREPDQPDPLAEVADLFLQDSPPRLAKIKQHFMEKDAPMLERVAHSLKGSAGNLGARRLAGFCADLERLARTGHLDSAAKLVEQIGAEYQRVQAALEVEKNK